MYAFNLLIFHNRTFQALSDWQAIGDLIATRAPDIEVRIASEELPPIPFMETWQASRPSLVVSARRLSDYLPQGGAVYCGRSTGKRIEMEKLQAAGVPVPETWTLASFMSAPPDLGAGEFLVVKPDKRGRGIGVKLIRASELKSLAGEIRAEHGEDVLIQRYIEHSVDNRPAHYRVLTLFGSVLYCVRHSWREQRRPLPEIADTDGVIASNVTSSLLREMADDPDVIAIAKRAAAAVPERPVLGIDVIRETDTGKLYVMELNSGGRVWHLSSDRAASVVDPNDTRRLYEQFDALSVAADALIGATRTLAK